MAEYETMIEDSSVPAEQLRYGQVLPPAWEGANETVMYRPQGGNTYSYTNQNEIRIQVTGAGYADFSNTELQFKLQVSVGGTQDANSRIGVALTGGAACWIRALRVEGPEGNEIEFIDDYGLIYALWSYYGAAHRNRVKLDAIKEGMSMDNAAHGLAASINPSASVNTLGVAQTNVLGVGTMFAENWSAVASGGVVTDVWSTFANEVPQGPAGATVAGQTQMFSIKLLLGLFNANRYLPLVLLSKQCVVLVIQLQDPNIALRLLQGITGATPNAGVTVSYQITDPVLVVQNIRVNADHTATFRAALDAQGIPLQLSGTTYRCFKYQFTNATEATIPISMKVRSLKGLLAIFRPVAAIGNSRRNSFASTVWGLQQYVFQVGGQNYPQQPIIVDPVDDPAVATGVLGVGFRNKKANVLREIQKFFGSLNDVHAAPTIDPASWQYPFGCIAVCTETYPGSSGIAESGYNSLDRDEQMQLNLRCIGGNQPGLQIVNPTLNAPMQLTVAGNAAGAPATLTQYRYAMGGGDSLWAASGTPYQGVAAAGIAPSLNSYVQAGTGTGAPRTVALDAIDGGATMANIYGMCDIIFSVLPGGSFVSSF